MKLFKFICTAIYLIASADAISQPVAAECFSTGNASYCNNGFMVPVPRNLVRIANEELFQKFVAVESMSEYEILAGFVLKSQFDKADFLDGVTYYGVLSVLKALKNERITDDGFKKLCKDWDDEFSQYKNGVDVSEASITDEIREAIKNGIISKDDYKVVLTAVRQNLGQNEYKVIIRRTEELKKQGETVAKTESLISSAFMKVGSHCLVTKLVQFLDADVNLEHELHNLAEVHDEWVADIKNLNKAADKTSARKSLFYAMYILVALFAALIGRNFRKRHELTPKDGREIEVLDGPVGIWGWNTVPLLNLAAMVIINAYHFVTIYSPLIENGFMLNLISCWGDGVIGQKESLSVFMESIGALLMAVFAVRVIELAVARKRSYPKMCSFLFWANAVFVLIDTVVAANLYPGADPDSVKSIVRCFGFAIVWSTYFSKSIRIKNTFVK